MKRSETKVELTEKKEEEMVITDPSNENNQDIGNGNGWINIRK